MTKQECTAVEYKSSSGIKIVQIEVEKENQMPFKSYTILNSVFLNLIKN